MEPSRELRGKGGVYLIVNSRNGKVYVGKTSCFYRRCKQYLYDVREHRHDHINGYLLAAMTKLGQSNFDFVVAEFCDKDGASQCELEWMRRLKTTDRDYGYNLRMDSRTGMVAHPETVEKIRTNVTRQWAEGVRSDHAFKLRSYWEKSDTRKLEQAEVMRSALTKYTYRVHLPGGRIDAQYRELVELGYKNAMGYFSRKRQDTIVCKGTKIERVRRVS